MVLCGGVEVVNEDQGESGSVRGVDRVNLLIYGLD